MKKYVKYILVFLFFVLLFYLSPISGDDWGNYLVGSEGIKHSLGVAVGMYFDWEGRFISRILINILTYNKFLWNLINAGIITGIVYMGVKFVGEKPKRIIFPLMFLVILCMNLFTFSQVISWIAGNITYLFIIPILLWYFYYLLNNVKYNKWYVVIFSLINLFGTMFVENMAVVLVFGNMLLIIYKYIKNKKVDKWLIFYTFISVLSTLSMVLSPGTRYRNSVENLFFNELNAFEKIIYNIPNFVYYTFITNTFMLVLLSVSNYFLIKNNVEKKWLKYFLMMFMVFVPLFTIIGYLLSMFIDSSLLYLTDHNNLFVILYWFIYLGVLSILIYLFDKKDFRTLFLFLIGLMSNVVMLISPTWGFRTSFFTYLTFSIVALKIINVYVNENKIIIYLINSCLVCGTVFYLAFYINIWRCQNNIENIIKKEIEAKSDVIKIDAFPSFANCNINPENDYHIEKFKLYYGIDKDVKIELNYDRWKWLIFYKLR